MRKETVNIDNNKKSKEEELLLNIYHNKLYPPPIGNYNKDLIFDSSINMSSLSPLLFKNKPILLGDGSFSKVQLYFHKKSKIKYAVKKMNLLQIEKLSHNKNIVDNEINIHGRINHPNIIRLYNIYKNKNDCYLILEYASNATLFEIIREKKGLTEGVAFYYFIQTLNAIYFLHLHSITHRDLKPENLLINENNILKLCDFGWSVKLNNNKRTTFCGTVEYMAPEIIKKQKYDESIDIWSLGVLLYELVHSYSPFCSEDSDIKKIGDNIIQKPLSFKEGLSNECKDLIKKLLIKDSSRRIKIEEIYQHSFMTKYINIIYSQINSNIYLNENNKKEINEVNINNNENIDLGNNNINNNKVFKNVIYKKNEKMKNKGYYYKKINNNIKNCDNSTKNTELQNSKYNYENNMNKDDIKRDTDLIFASIPSEPSPKVIPESKNYKEIKKLSSYFNLNKVINNPIRNKNESIHISNTSRNKRNCINIEKDNIKTIFKNQNKISHVKSFSLGQNIQNISELKDNRLKIIISINNTQNKNYIKNLSSKNKNSLSKHLKEKYIKNQNVLGMYNKINPLQQIINYNKNNTKKNNKCINQTYLLENKNILNINTNQNNNIIEYNPKDNKEFSIINIKRNNQNKKIKNISYSKNNDTKTDNNISYQYISMANTNNSNNTSNINIYNNSQTKDKNKNLKNSKSIEQSKYLRRINSEYYNKIFIDSNNKRSGNKYQEIIQKKIKNIYNIKNDNITHKNSKSSINNKTLDRIIKNNFNNTINIIKLSKYKTDKNFIHPNLTQNFDIAMINHNIIQKKINSLNNKLSKNTKNKNMIKISNSKNTINDILIEISPKNIEVNKEKNMNKLFKSIKIKQKKFSKK